MIITFDSPTNLKDRLVKEAKKDQRSLSAYIRIALSEHLKRLDEAKSKSRNSPQNNR